MATSVRTLTIPARPTPMRPAEAGAEELGGWIDGNGCFYAAPEYSHLRVARELRQTGAGPTDPWDMRDGWVMVKTYGEAIFVPYGYTQAQLDCLADLVTHAPEGSYRDWLLDSLRLVRRMENPEE